MSGKRDMLNILNTQMNDWALSKDVLHHTGAVSSRPVTEIWLRIKHNGHLEGIAAMH